MRDRLIGLLDKTDLAIGSCAGVVEPERLASLIALTKRARARLSYPEHVLVVALAGGTGSGKSSLMNAMTGEELVDVGGTRPTTSEASVAVPQSIGSSMDGYLDILGIEKRYVFAGPGFCIIDLPDTDSVEVTHRHRVDSLLPMVDLVIWVVDPEKYRDARMHDGYLKPLAEYAPQFVFVLNQADRLAGSDVSTVVQDLVDALRSDGIDGPMVIPVSASPPAGPPLGIDDLFELLETRRADPQMLFSKLLTDLAGAARTLESEVGAPVDFDARAAATLEDAARAVVAGDPTSAGQTLTGFLDSVAAGLDGDSRAKVEKVAAEVTDHLERISAEVEPEPKPSPWFRRTVEPDPPDLEQTRRLIGEAMIRPVRAVLAKRAVALASVAELAVEVQSLSTATSR